MITDEDRLTVALHSLAHPEPPSPAPTERVLSRAHRARRVRAMTVATASLSVAVVAAVAVAGSGPRHSTSTAGAATNPDAVRLVAAVAASAQTSFRFTVTESNHAVAPGRPKDPHRFQLAGAFDPRVTKGYSISPDGMGFMVIGDLYYMRKAAGDRWVRMSKTADFLLVPGQENFGPLDPLATVDFVTQFDALKHGGSVTKTGTVGSGNATVERYSFKFNWKTKNADLPPIVPVAGVIDVNQRTQLVTTMSYTYTYAERAKKGTDRSFAERWDYSDYGRPVDVKVP